MNLPVLVVVFALLARSVLAADPEPPVVTPGSAPGAPPADAIVLFDGTSLAAWKGEGGGAPGWKIGNGHAEVRGGGILTTQDFGAVQLHIEWAAPAEVKGEGQGRGNSGVYLQGRYEIQVLDSHENKTYPNGQAGAFYGHAAPLVNASRRPGEWQAYDIIFHPPKAGTDGKVMPGSFTVFHNGVLVQDRTPVPGDATTAAKFAGVTPTGPIFLQDHGNPVRYRNIWVRRLD